MNLNSTERDKEISFNEDKHQYFVKNKKVDYSVTEFIHQFFPQFDPNQVIEKFYEIWQTNPNSPYFELSKEEIKELWENNGKEASRLGTKLHQDIEKHYNKEKVNNSSIEFSYFLEFFKEFSHLKPLKQEWIIFDEELSIAGSIDAVFSYEDEIILFDWKRSKEIKETNPNEQGFFPLSHLPNANYWHYSLQLNMYKYILEKNYNIKVNGMNLGVFHPNNESFKVIKVQNMEDDIKKLFELRIKELKN